ncbi:LexA family protein [Liquorilactobacillus nagelii]|jgi:repressor LexA|uniref:LexA family protein n=1 Tax=Liquorilactobacillus nagelii TaxID=82688 RepID=UPI002432423A|nr:XRE family transcriptional regulator [Liquorilactobacillus nagelii]MCI1700033.1 helix-turn-helix domain-containing protein [Liquorilactobacillus nagelii]
MSDLGNKKVLSNNIKRFMKQRGVERSKMAADLNVKYTTLTDWINGNVYPRIGSIEKIANYFNVEKSDLIERRPDNVIPITKTVKIPLLGEIACGDPILAEENIEEYIDEPVNYLPSGKCFYLKAKGDSMKPTIPSGSRVLIRQQPDVEDDEIAAVLMTDTNEATLKRIKRSNGTMFLMPDNPEFTPIIVGEDNPARILGKAIRYTSDL